mgnify:FL=1
MGISINIAAKTSAQEPVRLQLTQEPGRGRMIFSVLVDRTRLDDSDVRAVGYVNIPNLKDAEKSGHLNPETLREPFYVTQSEIDKALKDLLNQALRKQK